MSKYALRISHYLLEKDPAIEYFIPFTPKALVSLLDGEYGDAIGEIFSLNKEDLKELLEKSDGTLATFLKRHNLFDLKDENGENYFVELLDKDNQGDVWIINDPEEPEENSLGDYLADVKLISDTVDTVGFLEFERYIEGSKSVSDINEEAENTMMFRAQFFLEKVIFSIIVTIDESDDWTTIKWPVPPENFFEYINSFFPDIKNKSDGENVVQSLDEIFELAENSFSEKIVDIERFTESFLRLEIPNISYSLYAASYDYICKVFEILIGNRNDLLTDNLVEYIDKIHINLWEVSRHKPFWFIKLMNIRVGTDIIIKGLLNTNWSSFFIKILPKGIKKLENIKNLFEKTDEWWVCKAGFSRRVYNEIIGKYCKDRNGCFVIAIMDDGEYIALSGFDYKGELLNGNKLNSKTEKYNKVMNVIEKVLAGKAVHCNLNDSTKRYTEIVDSKKLNSIKYIKSYSYLKDDLKKEFIGNSVSKYNWGNVTEDRRNDYGYTFGCCERKILGNVLPEGQESIKQKIVFFSRWAPCVKCRPAIFALENNCYYAYADSYKNNLENEVKYNLSRYYVKENPYGVNEKKYEIIKEELKKDYIDSSKIQSQENDPDIKIYDDQYQIFKLYMFIYEGKESESGYLIQIKSYLLKPKYRYIQIGIDEEKGISLFCDKEEGKAFIGLKYTFLSKLGIKSVYDGDIYYWGEKSTEDLLKIELQSFCSDEKNKNVFGDMVEIDFTEQIVKNDTSGTSYTYIFPFYEKTKLLVLKQNSGVKKEGRISNIVINKSVEDIDISMCKYGMKNLSGVKSINLCCNSKKNNIVKLTRICKKLIEVCKVDKLLKEIEKEKKPGSKIEGEKKKLRDSIDKTFKDLNDDGGVFEDIIIHIK